MSYSHAAIRAAVERLLQSNPGALLKDVSLVLGIERHAIEQAFRHSGTKFAG